ncbi:MAG: hypothetical protein K0U68_14640 [Gammaproteobacteria bacterium]|nr:hypothetical protein [Gammaproteobacteria bacterium]
MKSLAMGLLLMWSLVVQAAQQAEIQKVGQPAPLDKKTTIDLPELVIDINYQAGKRCLVQPSDRVIERNLTLPYRQQTLYGSNACQLTD